jgi:hypothetical protein
MKNMSRALRRHHAARLKRARRYFAGLDNRADPRRSGMLVNTPAQCSCWMCGNFRRHVGPTRAELLHAIQLIEETLVMR